MLHLHNAKERDWCQLDVSVLGIEYWYCTVQRVLVLPQQCIVEHEPREAIVAQSQRRKFAFGRSHNLSEGFDSETLSCCLTPPYDYVNLHICSIV